MRLFIKVKTRSKKPGVEKLDESNGSTGSPRVGSAHSASSGQAGSPQVFIVRVREAPIEGKANEAVIKALAENLKIASWRIKILSGSASSNKVVEII